MEDNQKPSSSKPKPVFPSADQLPSELLSLSWCGYRFKWNGHKWAKPPASPRTGEGIGATAKYESDFLSFADAVVGAARHKLDGVGFVFRDQGYVGIDFDNCRDPKTGEIHSEVKNWLQWFKTTYAEVSVSSTGVHVICKGKIKKALTPTDLPGAPGVKVEVYSNGRYFASTGNRLDGHELQAGDCQSSIDKLLAHVGQPTASESESAPQRPMSKFTARKLHADNLAALRRATQGEGNATLNTCAFFAARAFAAGVFEQSEQQLKLELLMIVTKEWKHPHPEQGARSTIDSGWSGGIEAGPLTIRDSIVTNPRHVTEMVRQSELVLHSMGLKYFERNSELVNTAYGRDIPKTKDIDRAGDSVIIQQASHQTIVRDLDARATYVRLEKKGEEVKEQVVHVPGNLPGQIHDRVHSEVRDVPFSTLDMVTASPVLLPSGKAHQSIFDEGVLFVPRDQQQFPPISESPTRGDAVSAMKQFGDIFGGFPFVDPHKIAEWDQTASYSVALAGVLSLVARPYLRLGAIPLIAATAPTRRYGKTKIIEAISGAALGYKPTAVHFVDEVEFGKHLLPLMRAGDRAILIDNVERSLQSAKLCILITGGILRDRVLGESRDVVLKNYAVLFATGNNLVIGGDLSARSLRVDIDAKLERPESRHFKFDPVSRAIERHPQLVVAALTALRAYLLAGMEWKLERAAWGGFERWDRLVSGCLTWLGYADPYESRDRIINADPVRTANIGILEEWHKRYGSRVVSLAEIRKDEGEVYLALLKDNHWDGHHAQWVLRRLEGQVCNGYRLERLEGRSRFWVEKLGGRQESMPF